MNREQIARVIDPEAFDPPPSPAFGSPMEAQQRASYYETRKAAALEKADAILALAPKP